MIPCYELSHQETLTLYQVKTHDVRSFAASKAFQSGVSLVHAASKAFQSVHSLVQSSACHWKSYNTFTQFYLKDVPQADSDLLIWPGGGCPADPPLAHIYQ